MNDSKRTQPHTSEEIDRWVRQHKDELLQTTASLIQIPTENTPPTGEELPGQLYLKGMLEGMGARVDTFTPDEVADLTDHSAYWAGRTYKDRPNVVATFSGTGDGPSIGFSSHMDTASRQPLPWSESTPFGGEVKEGRLYGRGSYDMKGGLVASIFAVKAVQELGFRNRGDIVIESVVDEEWGGSNGTLAARLRGHNPNLVVIPEPSHMVICPAHLGVRIYRLTVRGESGMRFGGEDLAHPVVAMGRVIEAFTQFAERRNALPLPEVYAGGNPPPVDIMSVHAEGYGVPRECTLDFFFHFFEGETERSIADAVAGFVAELKDDPKLRGVTIKTEPLSRFLEPSSIPADAPEVTCAQRAMAAIGRETVVRGAPFACDGYVFNLHSPSRAVILGPGGARAHAEDEFALVDDLVDLVRAYAHMIVDWTGS